MGTVLDVTVLLALAAAGVVLALRLHAPPAYGPARASTWLAHPFTQLTLMCGLVLLNQLALDGFVRAELLELPRLLFAYLSIARLLDRAVYRTLVRPGTLMLASIAYAVPRGLAETSLPNPWTHEDMVVWLIACVAAPVWIMWVARGERGGTEFPGSESRPTGIVGLATFVTGALATSYLIRVMYDVTFLTNLRHLSAARGPLVAAWSAAALAHVGDGRFDGFVHRLRTATHEASPPASFLVRVATRALASFTVLFFLPSLALCSSGGRPLAPVVVVVVVLIALILGVVLEWAGGRPPLSSAARRPC